MTWQSLGSFTFSHSDIERDLGAVALTDGDDSIWVRMTQTSPAEPWEYSYGLLTWRSADGRDLGTTKAFPQTEGEVFRLGNGLSPVERGGRLVFLPRLWNRKWLYATTSTLTLSFEWQSGSYGSSGSGGGGGATPSIAGSFVNTAGAGLELVRVVFP